MIKTENYIHTMYYTRVVKLSTDRDDNTIIEIIPEGEEGLQIQLNRQNLNDFIELLQMAQEEKNPSDIFIKKEKHI